MTRKSLLIAAGMLVAFLGAARQDRAWVPVVSAQAARYDYQRHREAAIQMNAQAGQIHSLEDSRSLVDGIAAEFSDELPPRWATRGFRDRIARAEYETATDSGKLIPEERVADAWNRYVQEIGAPEETRVNVAEIHNLRDGYFATGKALWSRDSQTIWTMPNIYAVGADGKVADGCRALEAIRVLWDMGNTFENLRGARARVLKGELVSDWIERRRNDPDRGHTKATLTVLSGARDNPVEAAERRYVQEHGVAGMTRAVEGLLNDLLPAKGKG